MSASASAIGEELNLWERAQMLNGICPGCRGREFDEGFPAGVGAVVDGVMTTWARCRACKYEVEIRRPYKKNEPPL